ncbi:ABC transporter ATP-binding protein, partial [Bacillus sp. D-CC]
LIKFLHLLLNEEKDKVLDNYVIVDVDEEQLTLINKDIVVVKRNKGSYFNVLVSDVHKLPKGIAHRTISIEEISVLLTRSEK